MSQKSSPVAGKIARFVGLTIGLGAIGIVFGVIGALIGGKVLGGDSFGFGALGLALGGIIIGYPAGIIVGIVLIKKVLHRRGSLLLGIVGSIVGAAVIIGTIGPLNLNANTDLLFGLFLLTVPLFCLLGFFLKR